MAASRIIDKIAVIAIITALLITAAFTRGEALGIQKIVPEEASAVFTDNDLDADWNTEGATVITLTGDNAEIDGEGAYFRDGDLVIYAAGSYVLQGTLTDGSVIVDETSKTSGKTWILLNGAVVSCSDSAALDIEEADKVFLTLADGTENSFTSGAEYSETAVENSIRGAIFSRDDLTINGAGSLSVTAEYRHGIVCNDEDINWFLSAVDNPHNGLTFCAGSLSAGLQNDVPALARKYAKRTHFVHLRSTQVQPNGDFQEASHLGGRANVIELVRIFERENPSLPMRVDHGPCMLGDENGGYNAGYSFHGRMFALGQVEGVMATVRREIEEGK